MSALDTSETREEVAGLPARRAALQLLDAVMRRGQPLERALASATRNISRSEDRALAHAIASEVLRWTVDLDQLIDGVTRQKLADDAKVRMAVRIALAQVLILGTPAHAAIATALPLLSGGPRRLAHGVLGTLFRGKATLPDVPHLPEDAEQRWAKAWGGDMVAEAAHAFKTLPPLDLTLKDPAQTEDWATRLGGETLLHGHVRLPRDRSVIDLPGYDEGAWWVQNLAASIPARLLGEGEGKTVLDLCAAPGGKTMQLAANGWSVTAVDREGARLSRLRDNLTRTGLAADIVEADVMRWEPDGQVDAILLDAPCSATGIFASHPDVLHRVRASDIGILANVQARMLARVVQWLKPGGRIVYATCSLEPEEGEAIIATSGLKVESPQKQILPENLIPTPQGWLRMLPHHKMDGFFTALCTTY